MNFALIAVLVSAEHGTWSRLVYLSTRSVAASTRVCTACLESPLAVSSCMHM